MQKILYQAACTALLPCIQNDIESSVLLFYGKLTLCTVKGLSCFKYYTYFKCVVLNHTQGCQCNTMLQYLQFVHKSYNL